MAPGVWTGANKACIEAILGMRTYGGIVHCHAMAGGRVLLWREGWLSGIEVALLPTNVPFPGELWTRPSAARVLYAWRIVIRLTPSDLAASLIVGSLVPSRNSPVRIRWAISSFS